jgi:hypothetical protein
MSTFYDPERTPDPREWLALGEGQRIRLAQKYHQGARIKVPSVKAHAAIHAAVENQIAMGLGPTCRAMVRLQKEGLSRHDAIHAIGSVIAAFISEAVGPSPPSEPDYQNRFDAEIESLTSDRWKNAAGAGGDAG